MKRKVTEELRPKAQCYLKLSIRRTLTIKTTNLLDKLNKGYCGYDQAEFFMLLVGLWHSALGNSL